MIRNFINLSDINKSHLKKIILRAKKHKKSKTNIQSLKNVNLSMIFQKPSTRTRVSFELAIKELGGRAIILDETNTQLGRGESIADTAKVLSRYCQILMVRTNDHEKLIEFQKNSNMPVINGLSNMSHPCQILADIMTFEENRGNIKNKNITWLGDVNNVLYSWIEAANIFEFNLKIAYPKEIKKKSFFSNFSKINKKFVSSSHDAKVAALKSDCIITDTWFSMGNKKNKKLLNIFKPYQVNKDIMKLAKKNAVFMHCLPASRNQEVTSDIIDDHKISLVWDEAENRLHIQKAILEWCYNKI